MPLDIPPPPPSEESPPPPPPRPGMEEAEMMESQISLKLHEDDPPSTFSSSTDAPLEERVAELELKLATLSRLLQQAQRGGSGTMNASLCYGVVVSVLVNVL